MTSAIAKDSSRDKGKVRSQPDFDVETVSLLSTQAVGNYRQDPTAKKAYHTNMVEKVKHFWRKGSSLMDILSFIDYQGHGDNTTTQLWGTNEMNQVLSSLLEENVMVMCSKNPRKNDLLQPKRTIMCWMTDLAREFSIPGFLVICIFARTLVNPRHRV